MKTKSTLFFFAFALWVNINTVNAQVNVQDSLALVDLYNSTDGPHWSINTNWLTKSSVSTWFGITMGDSGKVAWINLFGNNLTGNLPSSLGSFARLFSLDLGYNYLSGSIPSSLGNLVELYFLNLGHNLLRGGIPTSLGNLAGLQYFYLYSNQLSGNIPASFGNLINLEEVEFSDNKLGGRIPSSLGNLVFLGDLALDLNQLKGTIPSSLGKLTNLRYLRLNNNQLSGAIPSSLGGLANLQQLSLNNNQLSIIPSTLGNLMSLQTLHLDNNQFTNIPSSLGNLANLRSLYLNNNQLDSIPSSLVNLVSLHTLYLSNNLLSGSIPSFLGNLKNLFSLHLDYNRFTGSIPSSIGNSIKLHYIFLNHNRLSGRVPPFAFRLHLYLNLRHNYFIFDGLEELAQTVFSRPQYDKQHRIPIHQNGNTLSVSAGGTLSNNTYKWYRYREAGDTIVIKGDSVFHPTQSGTYLVRVNNSIATQLTLYSDSIVYIAPEEPAIASAQHTLQANNKANVFMVYPNPVKDVLHVETTGSASFSLVNQSGKILLTTNITGKGIINVSGLPAGLYYLKNNETRKVEKIVIGE
jgi:Leucine-rich repeat (LRR) protein